MNFRFLFLSLFVCIFFVFSKASVGQIFDEQFDHWPQDLKINGTIILHNDLKDTSAIRRASLKFRPNIKSPQDDEKLTGTFLTNVAEKDIRSGRLPWYLEFKKTSRIFDVKNFEAEALKADLTKTELLLLTLDSKSQLDSPTLTKLSLFLKTYVAEGRLLVADETATKWLAKFVVVGGVTVPNVSKGLNVIPDSLIETNFSGSTDERRVRSVLAAYPRTVGIGLKPDTCLVFRGRKMYTSEYGEAKFMLAANDRLAQRNHVIGAKKKKTNRLDFENNLVDLTEWRRDAIDRTLPKFPPQSPRDPVVENGTLVIVGGGGMPRNLMNQLVEMAGGKDARMVYVPCSERDSLQAPQRTVEGWKRLGVKSATFIHTKDRNKANSDEAFLEPLKNATGIWFGGGRQWNFSDSYYGTKAHKLMKDVLKRRGVIGGSSAGASIQARYLARATPIANYKIMAPGYERGGLGFISGVAIDQHFSQRGRQKDMTQLMRVHPQLLGIGIDEATAIIVKKSEAKVVGRGKVHFYNRKIPVYPNKPDYIALAAGSAYDLKARKVLVDSSAVKAESKAEESDLVPERK